MSSEPGEILSTVKTSFSLQRRAYERYKKIFRVGKEDRIRV